MRLVVARCSVEYGGRLTTSLPSAVRLLMVKADGCLSVHSDEGAKPLNWMPAGCHTSFADDRWVLSNPKGEVLTIAIEEILSDVTHELGHEPGITKDGVEAHLQEILADRPDLVGEGFTLVRREYPTDIGPVDIMFRDADGAYVACEVKRIGGFNGVTQLGRYLDRLNRDPMISPVRGVYAAQRIRPQARVIAEDQGIRCVVIDYDSLKGGDVAPEEAGKLF